MHLHTLALELGITVNVLVNQLSMAEYMDWLQYFKQINEPKELEPKDLIGIFKNGDSS